MHTPEDSTTRRDRSRRGVALIIVLGFLSIMVLMAVAFLTQARVERMVASSSLEGMRTRQMAQTAIAGAMQDYLNALKSISQAETDHDVFLSGDNPGTIQNYYSGQTIGNDRLMIGKVEDWLTEGHLLAGKGGGDATDDVRNAEWIWVREQPGARSRILGRYAYACFDMSGLLDANLLGTEYGDNVPQYGDATNRNSVRKMVLEALRQETGSEGQRKLAFHQNTWKGFDTPAALLNLTDGKVNDGDDDNAYNRWTGTDMPEGDPIDVDGLAPYSYAALHLGADQTKKVPCDPASIVADSYANSALEKIKGDTHISELIKSMEDYVSAPASPPQGVDYPSVKNVPMFNEIGVRVGFAKLTPDVLDTNTGTMVSTYELRVYLKTEFWYPFPSQDNERPDRFVMEPSIGADRNAGGQSNIWVQMRGDSVVAGPQELIAGGMGSAVQVRADYNNGAPYHSDSGAEVMFNFPLTKLNGDAQLPADMQLRVARVAISKEVPLTLKTQTGTQVDSTPNDETPDKLEMFYRPSVVLAPGATMPETFSWEVGDPRLNHRASSWDSTETPSWGAVNGTAEDAISRVDGLAPGTNLYCRNGPMRSPAELGYIPTTTPWTTLDIFSDDGIGLMNKLVCDPDIYDILENHDVFFTNGTINPYTRNTNVLNAAFYGIDIREVPGMANDPDDDERLNGGDLDDLVEEMMKADTKNGSAGWAAILDNKSLVADLNKNQRISILGNTWGLFNESDRLFVVVVIAQSIKEGSSETGKGNWDPAEDVLSGERRAVALCWLDGSADGSADTLTQEMNIIMFQYLNE